MPQGMQVFNADGSIQIDTASRITRVLDNFVLPTSDGSRSIAGLNTGQPFWFTLPAGVNYDVTKALVQPVISASGTTLSWAWTDAYPTLRRSMPIIVGVY